MRFQQKRFSAHKCLEIGLPHRMMFRWTFLSVLQSIRPLPRYQATERKAGHRKGYMATPEFSLRRLKKNSEKENKRRKMQIAAKQLEIPSTLQITTKTGHQPLRWNQKLHQRLKQGSGTLFQFAVVRGPKGSIFATWLALSKAWMRTARRS